MNKFKMHSVLCMSPFSLNSERIKWKENKRKLLLHSARRLHLLVSTLLWHVRVEVVLYGADCPVGELLLRQVEADAA